LGIPGVKVGALAHPAEP